MNTTHALLEAAKLAVDELRRLGLNEKSFGLYQLLAAMKAFETPSNPPPAPVGKPLTPAQQHDRELWARAEKARKRGEEQLAQLNPPAPAEREHTVALDIGHAIHAHAERALDTDWLTTDAGIAWQVDDLWCRNRPDSAVTLIKRVRSDAYQAGFEAGRKAGGR